MPVWDDTLMGTGIEQIDHDHHELVERLNELGQAMKRGRGRAAMSELLSYLEQYVREHFAYEEALMQRSGYPEYEEHKAKHEAFKEALAARTAAFARAPDERLVTIEIHGWIMNWLSDHALNVDAKLGDYVKDHGGA
jgi:hemerythrin